MSSGNFLKLIDVAVFIGLFYLGLEFHVDDPNIFDVVYVTAMFYVLIRKHDINTVTLVLIVMLIRLSDSVLFFDYEDFNGYVFYSTLVLINLFGVGLIWFRPWLVSNFGPNFVRNHNGLAVTHQDLMMGFLFSVQALFQLLALLEHVSRHFDDIGLGGIFDVHWWREHSLFIYTRYEMGQFVFSVAGLAILYFMTFDASKTRHDHK